jgi:pyruvate dehydrogenase E2 component (dihydrolipoamide acetyltransferase)
MIPVIMPQIGQDSPRGRIVRWLKRVNDVVQRGDVILTVESEKAIFEVTAEQAGVVLKILYPEDAEVDILQPVAFLGESGEELSTVALAPPPAVPSIEPDQKVASPAAPPPPDGSLPLATPAVRRLARERGVDLRTVRGSGPAGRVTRDDVEAVGRTPAGATDDLTVAFSPMRQQIADRLSQSKLTIPHFFLLADIDMGKVQQLRASANRAEGVHLTVTDFLIKAVAQTLREYPRLNAYVERDRVVLKGRINIGVATAIEPGPSEPDGGGLLVPVIADADLKSVYEISARSREVTRAARRRLIDAGVASTFTISSLGAHGISCFAPIINPPECAILAVGAITPRAVPRASAIEVREMMTVTLACDHRAVDGVYAAGFLNAMKTWLENLDGIG